MVRNDPPSFGVLFPFEMEPGIEVATPRPRRTLRTRPPVMIRGATPGTSPPSLQLHAGDCDRREIHLLDPKSRILKNDPEQEPRWPVAMAQDLESGSLQPSRSDPDAIAGGRT